MALDIDTDARRIDCIPAAGIAERHRNTVLSENVYVGRREMVKSKFKACIDIDT